MGASETATTTLGAAGSGAAIGGAIGAAGGPIGAAGGAIIGGVIGLIGGLISWYGEDKAEELLQKARDKYGELDPNAVYDIAKTALPPSAFEKITTDARYKDAQIAALDKMRGITEGGGIDPGERADINRVQNEAARADSANRQQILEGMQSRGTSGSGAELAMQLQGAQGAADRTHQGSLDAAAQARTRYFQALQAQGSMASGMREQDFGEQARIAQAKDERERMNGDIARNAAQNRFNNQLAQIDGQTGLSRNIATMETNSADHAGQTVAAAGNVLGAGYVKSQNPARNPDGTLVVDPNDPNKDKK